MITYFLPFSLELKWESISTIPLHFVHSTINKELIYLLTVTVFGLSSVMAILQYSSEFIIRAFGNLNKGNTLFLNEKFYTLI